MEKTIKDFYIGRKFMYKTKYGGTVHGVIHDMVMAHRCNILGGSSYKKREFTVISENGVPYPLNDVFVSDEYELYESLQDVLERLGFTHIGGSSFWGKDIWSGGRSLSVQARLDPDKDAPFIRCYLALGKFVMRVKTPTDLEVVIENLEND